jgi:tRNA A-37 threonylcarbamoyl transferase component Bud32
VTENSLEQTLRDLPTVGKLIKDRGFRQVWRFESNGKPYYLKFYPRFSGDLKRIIRGNSAAFEFKRLQALQKAKISAPRAIAELIGFRLNGQIGDAVILQAIEPSVPLDQYLWEFQNRGQPIPNHRALVTAILDLVKQLAAAGLGHNDLHPGNMLFQDGKLFLLDAHAIRFGGLKLRDIQQLAHSLKPWATRTDLHRGWNLLGRGGPMPKNNPVTRRIWRKLQTRIGSENKYFGRFSRGDWSGIFFEHFKFPHRWASASSLKISIEDWEKAWPTLWQQIETDQLSVLKRSAGGDVLAGEITVGGSIVKIVVKRPFKRRLRRYFTEIFRGSRAWWGWQKAWKLIYRDIPTAWPLIIIERRRLGYIVDALVVFQRVEGPTLGDIDLDVLPAERRENLFRRMGNILRRIDEMSMHHYDSKSSNWMVRDDPVIGPEPILIDVDGIRRHPLPAFGIQRLLRSMREHSQYTPQDSLWLCQGYAPFSASMIQQEAVDEPAGEGL